MDKIKISNHQLRAFVVLYTCGTSIIVLATSVISFAKQDAWISSIIAIVVGLLFIWLYVSLGSLHPNKTLVEILQTVFGKWIGGFISIFFIFYCFVNLASVINHIHAFITTQDLSGTPPYVIDFLFIVALVVALLYGLETFVRSAEILVYVVSVMLIFAMLLCIPNIQINNLFPILENGITPVLKASLIASDIMTWPLIVMIMIYPLNVENIKEARKSIFQGYVWGAFLIFITDIMAILVLAPTIGAQTAYPIYLLAKMINVGNTFDALGRYCCRCLGNYCIF